MLLFRIALIALLGLLFASVVRADPEAPPSPSASPSVVPTVEPSPADSQQALFRLLTGNTRYREDRSIHANQGAFARSKASMREYPWAVIVTCSDSRVPPEIIFDQGLGDLTVIRSWGNYVGDTAVGSIQHAIEDHGPNLVVVLSHKRCGALRSAIEGKKESGPVAKIIAQVQPSIAIARRYNGDLFENACKENARLVVLRLMSYPFVAQRIKSGQLRVVPAYYDLDSGHVKVLNLNKQPDR